MTTTDFKLTRTVLRPNRKNNKESIHKCKFLRHHSMRKFLDSNHILVSKIFIHIVFWGFQLTKMVPNSLYEIRTQLLFAAHKWYIVKLRAEFG